MNYDLHVSYKQILNVSKIINNYDTQVPVNPFSWNCSSRTMLPLNVGNGSCVDS